MRELKVLAVMLAAILTHCRGAPNTLPSRITLPVQQCELFDSLRGRPTLEIANFFHHVRRLFLGQCKKSHHLLYFSSLTLILCSYHVPVQMIWFRYGS
jgi:hypothetical protein